MSTETEIQPVPELILASEFPTLADRPAGLYNQKAADWADSENAMVQRARETALVTHNNAQVSVEQAAKAVGAAEAAQLDAQATAEDRIATADDRLAVSEDRDAVEIIATAFGDVSAAVGIASDKADIATEQAGIATTKAGEATSESLAAQNAANTAVAARDAALLTSATYKAFETRSLMDADLEVAAGHSAIVLDDPTPSNNGWYYKLGASGTGSWERLANQPASTSALERRIAEVTASPSFVPLAKNKEGRAPIWLQDGGFNAGRVSEDFAQKVFAHDNRRPYAPLSSPISSYLPAATDGRTLCKHRAKIGRLISGDPTAKLKIAIAGDSWAAFPAIPLAIRTLLEGAFPNAGEGWQSVFPSYKMNGISLTRSSGWTEVDGSATGTFPYGAGPDGHNIHTTTATATLTLANIKATDLYIYCQSVTGAFRYRVDGGAWTTVTGTGDNTVRVVSITGLADQAHTLSIDTTGNAGVVSLHGFYATRNVRGVEVVKMGNPGTTGRMMRNYAQYVQPAAQTMDLDAVVFLLGTNDYQTGSSTVEEYIAGLTETAAAFRAATPEVGLIFVAPADSNGTASRPLTEYRDALYEFCIANGHEFYNMHDLWPAWATANALGIWADNLHTNNNGASSFAHDLNQRLLNV